MTRCNHTAWLSFHEGDPILFRHTSTLSDLVASMNTPAQTWPSLVVLLDEASSGSLIDQVLPRPGRRAHHGEEKGVSLQIDTDTVFSDRPVLLARSNFVTGSKLTLEPDKALCHRHTVRECSELTVASSDLVHDVHNNLLYPFADVVCLFVSGRSGFHRVIDHLEAWCERAQKEPRAPRPRMLVIAAPDEKRCPAKVHADLLTDLQKRTGRCNADLLSHITVFVNHDSRQPLRDRVRWETDISRDVRGRSCTLLNALHWEQLFYRACDHFVASGQGAFDQLTAARLHRPVSATLGVHLADIFTRLDLYSDMTAFAAPYIAECLLLDNYTVDVHGTYA
jgi:hypothetical protein